MVHQRFDGGLGVANWVARGVLVPAASDELGHNPEKEKQVTCVDQTT